MITLEHLKSRVHYDPLTGIFTWLNGPLEGQRAGHVHSRGYRHLLGNKEHRLAHLYMTGEVPEMVDHDDGNVSNNRWSNILPSDPVRNNRNAARRHDNTVGVCGVHWCNHRRRWVMQIGMNGKRAQKTFTTLLDACAARKSAELALGYHPNHGAR